MCSLPCFRDSKVPVCERFCSSFGGKTTTTTKKKTGLHGKYDNAFQTGRTKLFKSIFDHVGNV